jgi:1-deoxy-D-xylulose-5-phosphate reductoisomerase
MNAAAPRRVVSLGATGSIGRQAADIIAANPQRFRLVALAASGSRPDDLARQIELLRPEFVAVTDPGAAAELRGRFPGTAVADGPGAAEEAARFPADVVLNGIAGAAGLRPTLAALGTGARLALANKESLIIGGPVVGRAAAPGQIVPVDSEHSALAQALRAGRREEVRRLILTASGGPFRGWTAAQLASVTPTQALAHPTWDMGPLVTINSATLVNKGLELIEAHLLFDMPLDDIEVVVHPQSVVHSMVEFVDGSTLAQASPPDMRLPIALGLGWPDRVPGAAPACDWSGATTWTFEPVDHDTFPALRLAADVAREAGVLPAVFNAADETAVAAFLNGRVTFPGIVETVEQVVADYDGRFDRNDPVADDVLAADAWARSQAAHVLSARR